VDGFAPFHGGETILKDGRVVGQTSSSGFGHSIGKTIAFAWLPAELAGERDFSIEAFGVTYSATRAERTTYDPGNERLLS
jgi:4-methylaminobutanoate oxidase (formaldehyde-forming)